MRISVIGPLVIMIALTACFGEPLPEIYGVYVTDGNRLVELSDRTPEEERADFQPEAHILLFDKVVTNPNFDPDQHFTILRRHYLRSQIVKVVRRDKSLKEVRVIARASSVFGDYVPVGYKPVVENPEMLNAIPMDPLKPGLYGVSRVGVSSTDFFHFAIGLGKKPERDSEHNGCVDLHTQKTDFGSGFSWDKWWQTTQGKGREDGTYKNCSILDDMADAWRSEALTFLENGNFTEAVMYGLAVLGAGPNEDFEEVMFGTLLAKIQENSESSNWRVAASVADLALKLRPEHSEILQLRDSAAAKLEGARRVEEQKRKEAQAARAARIDVSKKPTKELARFTEVKPMPFDLRPVDQPVVLTDVNLRCSEEGYHNTLIWFGDVRGTPETKEGQQFQGMGPIFPLVSIETKSRMIVVKFGSSGERDSFFTALIDALGAWRARYPDLQNN